MISMIRPLAAAMSLLLLTGCASVINESLPTGNHPANAAATESPMPTPSNTLAMAAPSVSTGPAAIETAAGGDHGADTMRGMSSTTKPATVPAAYVCPMHPQVTSNEPGKCPICSMKLKATGKPPAAPSDHVHGGQP